MRISRNTILRIVHETLSPEQIRQSFIYWDSRIRKEGEEIRTGPLSTTMPFDGMLVFVDLAPRLNWAHPCLYLLVNVHDLRTQVVQASFTPFGREFPDTVTIVLRYGKRPPHGRYFWVFDDGTEGGLP